MSKINNEIVEQESVRLDKKVTVRSIAPWATGSSRKTSNGDFSVPPLGTALLTREEAIAQGQNGNKLLTGIDGVGSHATWFIDDAYVRSELSFDLEDKKQETVTTEKIKKIFTIKSMKDFEDHIKEIIVTRAEKAFLMRTISSLKINDYQKIAFCIDYTGIKP